MACTLKTTETLTLLPEAISCEELHSSIFIIIFKDYPQ